MKKNRLTYPGLLLSILLFAFVTRVWRIHIPSEYMFDEVYHALTAKLIARNDVRAYEWWNPPVEPNTAVDWLHPPLAKYTQALFMKVFGETSFGWRISSALFGVGVIYLTFILARNVFKDEKIGLIAALLASLDGLLLAQSRIAMNDIHVTFFILLTLILYHSYRQEYFESQKKSFLPQKWHKLGGVAFVAGLACGSKWSGAFVVGSILLFEGYFWLSYCVPALFRQKWQSVAQLCKQGLLTFLVLTVIPAITYVASYAQMFLQGKNFKHFQDLHYQIWYYQTHLDATHPYGSRPWQWISNMRPVWYYVDYISDTTQANIFAFGNSILFWVGILCVLLTISLLIGLGLGADKKQLPLVLQEKRTLLGLFFILQNYFIVWFPWQFSPRIMFFYHYTPAVPLLSIIVGWWIWQNWSFELNGKPVGKYLSSAILSLTVLFFIIWFPHWTALPVPKDLADTVYFFTKSWR